VTKPNTDHNQLRCVANINTFRDSFFLSCRAKSIFPPPSHIPSPMYQQRLGDSRRGCARRHRPPKTRLAGSALTLLFSCSFFSGKRKEIRIANSSEKCAGIFSFFFHELIHSVTSDLTKGLMNTERTLHEYLTFFFQEGTLGMIPSASSFPPSHQPSSKIREVLAFSSVTMFGFQVGRISRRRLKGLNLLSICQNQL
jgi:hypothetical protein